MRVTTLYSVDIDLCSHEGTAEKNSKVYEIKDPQPTCSSSATASASQPLPNRALNLRNRPASSSSTFNSFVRLGFHRGLLRASLLLLYTLAGLVVRWTKELPSDSVISCVKVYGLLGRRSSEACRHCCVEVQRGVMEPNRGADCLIKAIVVLRCELSSSSKQRFGGDADFVESWQDIFLPPQGPVISSSSSAKQSIVLPNRADEQCYAQWS